MPKVEDLIQQSSFIFIGTIHKLKAATIPAVPVSDSTVVVKVDEVFQAPEMLGDQTGKEITVQLAESQRVEEGQQLVFFTNGWLYGESIAVQEVGRREVRENISRRLPRQIANTVQKVADEELQGRIASADVVVAGKISNIRPVEPSGRQRIRVSEHDPQWWAGVIIVEAVEKGRLVGDSVMFLFSASTDVKWYQAPKFHAGQEGVWILHTGEVEELGAEVYTVIDPLDYHPRDQLDRIRDLISGI